MTAKAHGRVSDYKFRIAIRDGHHVRHLAELLNGVVGGPPVGKGSGLQTGYRIPRGDLPSGRIWFGEPVNDDAEFTLEVK